MNFRTQATILKEKRRRAWLSTNGIATKDAVPEFLNGNKRAKVTIHSQIDDSHFDNNTDTTPYFGNEEVLSDEQESIKDAQATLAGEMPLFVPSHSIIRRSKAIVSQTQYEQRMETLNTTQHNSVNVLPGMNHYLSKDAYVSTINDAFDALNITESGRKLLINSICLPLQASIPDLEFVIDEVLKPRDEKQQLSLLRVSVCPNDCIVYCGPDLQRLDRCPRCNCERFSHCRKMTCRRLPYSQCRCRTREKRIPLKSFYYRPIIPLIYDLLSTENFASICSYGLNAMSHNLYSDHDDYMYSGICSGKEAQEQLLLMHNRYEEFIRSVDATTEEIKEISLLAADYFDGVQWHKRSVGHYYPLFISFKNLPTRVCNRSGEGTFLVAFGTNKPKSVAVRTLFRDFFIEELKAFSAGKGEELTVRGRRYFVQVSASVHVYDIKAKEELEGTTLVSSLQGCSCGMRGISCRVNRSNRKPSTVYMLGNRYLLPIRHMLRQFAQNAHREPPNFYTNNGEGEVLCQRGQQEVLRLQPRRTAAEFVHDREFCNLFFDGNIENDRIVWLSFGTCTRETIQRHVFYPHADFRLPTAIQPVTTLQYLQIGAEALATKVKIGNQRSCTPFALLPYFSYEKHCLNGLMHCLSNIFATTINMMRSDPENDYITANLITYCRERGIHPQMDIDPRRAPWLVTAAEQVSMDALMDCVNRHKGVESDKVPKHIFLRTGMLKSAQQISILANFLPLLIYRCVGERMPVAYKAFYAALSQCARMLLRKTITNRDIQQTHDM